MMDSTVEPWGPVDELVVAVGGRDEQLTAAIVAAGPDRVADLLAWEVRTRCVPPAGCDGCAINLRIAFEDTVFRYHVSFEDGVTVVKPGDADGVLAAIRYAMVDLLRLVYATRPGYRSTSREVEVLAWPWEGKHEPVGDEEASGEADPVAREMARLVSNNLRLVRSVDAVLNACSAKPFTLTDLSTTYGTDKWASLHWFMPHYERYLGEFRHDPVRILEIGIGGWNAPDFGGESLYMWQRFFPRGLVYGLDVFDKPGVTGPRIRTIRGDQTDVALLREIGERFGPFDLVIDDGSHVNSHVQISYGALFPYVRPGGYYVIEDLQTSYWPVLGGELPPGSPATTVGWLKDMIDRVHYREYTDVDPAEARAAEHPSDVFVHHNLAFLAKGINHEQGIPRYAQDTVTAIQDTH